MAFQPPLSQNLTEIQAKSISQYSALKSIVAAPSRSYPNVPADKQLTIFDYLLQITTVVAGAALIDVLMKKYLDSIFNPNNDKLERVILKGIAKHYDKKGATINSSMSNEEWMYSRVLPYMHEVFIVIKGLIVRQILTLIFGPKQKMNPNPSIPLTANEENDYLEDSVYASLLFSPSNEKDLNTVGDVEYNLIKIKEQKQRGQVQFVISCQDVKVQLPPDFEPYSQSIILELQNAQYATQNGGVVGTIVNPTVIFDFVTTHIKNETQRINQPENKNAVRKSFIRILLEQMFGMLCVTFLAHLPSILNIISQKIIEDSNTNTDPNTQIIDENLAIGLAVDLMPRPKALKEMETADPSQFDQSTIFARTVLNLLYATLISMMFKFIFKELKKLIKNAFAKKAAARARRKAFKLNHIAEKINKAQQDIDRGLRVIQGLKELSGLIDPDSENFT
jgi:hypothetical protein